LLIESMRAVSYSKNNQLTLLHRGAEFFPALKRAIDAAHAEIYLEIYIFADDATADVIKSALMRAAQRGVAVYVLVDWLGTGQKSISQLARDFASAGVNFRTFNPWFHRGFVRTHRKIMVVDRTLAFLGGLNINDDCFSDDGSHVSLPAPRWDFAVAIHGQLVNAIHEAAAAQWLGYGLKDIKTRLQNLRRLRSQHTKPALTVAEAGLVVRDNLRNRRTIQRSLLHAIGHAHQSIYLVTPYFAPGRKLRHSLAMAAQRGVKVTLMVGVGQFRLQDAVTQSFYPLLSEAGVELIEYSKTQLHGKVAVVDDEWATVGSSNYDGLSLFVNHEANIVVRDADFANTLRSHIAQGVLEGRVVTANEVANISRVRRALNWLAYLFYKSVLQIITFGSYAK
jgi:cardiolipin synthase